MANFIIVPPRLVVGSVTGASGVVTSINALRGDITLAAGAGLQLGITSRTFTFSVTPNTYVLRSGDTMTGNLQFTPSGGAYGLKLRADTSDPAQYATGAMYYNTATQTLRVYDSGSWQSIYNVSGLTEVAADARYLKLDASNSPLTGDLSMGTASFIFGSKGADPFSGSAGQTYFNTTDKILRIYNGSSWTEVGGGVTSITVGSGLTPTGTITSTGSFAVDQSYSFNWTGAHSHTAAITFASSQTFDIAKLDTPTQDTGDIIYRAGTGWTNLPVGSSNQVLTVVGGEPSWEYVDAISTTTIGYPEDVGGYTDGFFDTWTGSTMISEAFDDVNELLSLLAPERAGVLTGSSLTQSSVPTFYTAKLSDGLTSDWYQGGKTAGSTIATYYVAGTSSGAFTLLTPSTSTVFRAGKKDTPVTWGTTTHVLYNATYPSGTTVDTVSLVTNPSIPVTSGTLTVTDVATYNSIWSKANARIIYTSTVEGYEAHAISHTEAGESAKLESWKDIYSASAANPSFAYGPVATETGAQDKYLSGIVYYGLNSAFSVEFTAASGIFNRCYNATRVARVSSTGMSNVDVSPASPPNYLATYDRTGGSDVDITLNTANKATPNKYLTVTLYKASGNTTSGTAAINRAICTYSTQQSTATTDIFMDEAYRLVLDTTDAWDSTDALVSGNAQQRITGTDTASLQYPDSTDYPGFTGDQEYQRFIYKTSASTGFLTLANLTYTNIAPYGTGDINVLLHLDYSDRWFDLGVVQGANGNDGTARNQAIAARTSSSSGNTVYWSLGTYSTGVPGSGNEGRYRLVIIFRNSNRSITSITGG